MLSYFAIFNDFVMLEKSDSVKCVSAQIFLGGRSRRARARTVPNVISHRTLVENISRSTPKPVSEWYTTILIRTCGGTYIPYIPTSYNIS